VKRSVVLLAVFIAAAGLLQGCTADPAPEAPATETGGVTADTAAAEPDAPYEMPEVETAEPERIDELVSAAEGKVLVLNLWATWCPPCVAEMPYFARFYETMNREKTAFLSVSADDVSTLDDAVLPFMERQRIPFPVYLMEGRDPGAFTDALRTEISGGLPTTIFYDANGNVAKVVERDMNLDELREMVAELGGV